MVMTEQFNYMTKGGESFSLSNLSRRLFLNTAPLTKVRRQEESNNFDSETQGKILYENFDIFYNDPHNLQCVRTLLNKKRFFDAQNIEEKCIYKAYKIINEITRNIVIAQRVVSEEMTLEEAITSSSKNYNDIISQELRKKQDKLFKFFDFLKITKIIDIIGSNAKHKLIETAEVITSSMEVRANQRQFIYSSQYPLSRRQRAANLYNEAIQNYLDSKSRCATNSNSYNLDLFYLYPEKNHEILRYLISVLRERLQGGSNKGNQESSGAVNELYQEYSNSDIKYCILMITTLIVNIFKEVNLKRQQLRLKFDLNDDRASSSHWIQEGDFLFGTVPNYYVNFVEFTSNVSESEEYYNEYSQLLKDFSKLLNYSNLSQVTCYLWRCIIH